MTRYVSLFLVGVILFFDFILAQDQLFPTTSKEKPGEAQQFLPPYESAVRGTALETPIDANEYIVGPGDRFVITILSTEPYMELVTVTPTGELILPKIGSLPVSGLTVQRVTDKVKEAIAKSYVAYESNCVLYGIREIRVSATGAVREAGFHTVTPLSRVTDLLTVAGGVKSSGALNRVELRRAGDTVRRLDLVSYYQDGDISHNPFLRDGDQIIVPYGDISNDLVLVRGLAATPIYYPIRSGETLATLIRRIPIENQADISLVTINRSREQSFGDAQEVTAGQFANVSVHPGDEIYISRITIISVTGEVRKPGNYAVQPGMKAKNYIVLAGGVTQDGASTRVLIERETGGKVRGLETDIQAGDTIYVPRSFERVFLGQLGMIQAALTFLNLYMTFLAASR